MSLAPPSPSPLVPGYRLDRYELLCPIADGGMAQVWVARLLGKHGFEKLVAIKSILPKYASDPQFQRMFLDEARIASGIEHTNVAQIFDLGDEHGVLYLAMEYVDGDALTKLYRVLEKKGQLLPPGIILRILADTCGGLHAAHELRAKNGQHLGVVHRDFSPQNILVSMHGVAKLIDFGIAKARDRVAGETSSGTLKGKVQYMAPEQALGGGIDRRADVFSVGATLYHLLSGKLAFDGPNQLATLHMLASGTKPAPLPDRVPPAVAAVVTRAMAHDREKRYATAAELQAALEAAMVSAGLVTTATEVAAFVEQHTADRAMNRREAIEMALLAAEDRSRMQELLKPPNPDSSISNLGGLKLGGPHAPSERALTVPGFKAISPDAKLPPPPSVPTPATLGMAALGTSIGPLPVRSYRNLAMAALAVGGVVVGVILTVALRGGGSSAEPGAGAPASGGAASSTQVGAPTTVAAAVFAAPAPAPSAAPAEETREAAAATATAAVAPSSVVAPTRPAAQRAAPPRGASGSARAPANAGTRKVIPKDIENGF